MERPTVEPWTKRAIISRSVIVFSPNLTGPKTPRLLMDSLT